MNMGPILAEAYNSANQIIRSSTFNIPSSQLQSETFRTSLSSIDYDSILNKISINLLFTFPLKFILNDKLSVTYPSQLSISSSFSDY